MFAPRDWRNGISGQGAKSDEREAIQRARQATQCEEREAIRSSEGQGHVQRASGEDRELPGSIEPGRQEVRLRRSEAGNEPRWHHGSEEGRGTQGRPGGRAETVLVRSEDEVAVVRVTSGGPLLVRGPMRLVDEEGREVRTRRRINALCRCGRSAVQPFCDGTHKIVPFSPRAMNGSCSSAPRGGSPPAG